MNIGLFEVTDPSVQFKERKAARTIRVDIVYIYAVDPSVTKFDIEFQNR